MASAAANKVAIRTDSERQAYKAAPNRGRSRERARQVPSRSGVFPGARGLEFFEKG